MSLYEQLGGEPAIRKAVEIFYEKVLADDTVNHFFKNTDMNKQRDHQTKFLSFALGGPNKYSGRSMEKAHEGLNLQPIHFDAIVTHLTDTLKELGVSQEGIDQAIAKVAPLRDSILYK